MRALVTGGGGFLGRYIVEQLRARGDVIRVFCRGDYPELRSLGVEIVRGDLRDREAVVAACRDVDCVFHVAAVPGIWGAWRLFHETNTLGTLAVLEGCRRHQVPALVQTSSPSVVFGGEDHEGGDETLPYPTEWMCHYPHSKALAEQAVRDVGARGDLRTVALRPHLIWGPRDNHLIPRLIHRARTGRLRQVGDGTNRVSISYVENAAAAHLQAADALASGSLTSGNVYFINEPDPIPLWDWVNRLLDRAGLPPVRKRISATAARRLGAMCEGVWSTFRLRGEPPMTQFLAKQLAGAHWYRTDAATRDFGYAPQISIEEGLRRLEPELRKSVAR